MAARLLVVSLMVAMGGLALEAVNAREFDAKIEPNHSSAAFTVAIAGGITKVRGFFKEVDVTIVFDDEDITRSSVTAVIQAESIDTGIDIRDRDLRGPSFFDTSKHPELRFASRSIERRGEGFVAIGELTMRGVSRDVELPFIITRQDDRGGMPVLGVSISATVDRQDWGIGSGWRHDAIPNFIADEVVIEIDMWTKAGEPRP